MTKQVGSAARSSAKTAVSKKSPAAESVELPKGQTRRLDRLVHIVDHCTAAKLTADAMGEKFLSYMLAMAIQEARSHMREPSR